VPKVTAQNATRTLTLQKVQRVIKNCDHICERNTLMQWLYNMNYVTKHLARSDKCDA